MCIITNKKSVNCGVKSMGAKAQSWSQVCKQLSGIGGYVELDEGKKVRPLELMQSLGVHVRKNSYTPKDIFEAWSAKMMINGIAHIMRSVATTVVIDGKEYVLYTINDGNYVPVRHQELCPLVSMTDKRRGSNDVAVNAMNVLRGLQQSVFVSETLDKIAKSKEKAAKVVKGFVNIAAKRSDAPVWVEVALVDGAWEMGKVANVKVVVK